jgi:hypothetical protein
MMRNLKFILQARHIKQKYLLARRGKDLIIFGQVNTKQDVFIFLHEGICLDGDDVLELYLRFF